MQPEMIRDIFSPFARTNKETTEWCPDPVMFLGIHLDKLTELKELTKPLEPTNQEAEEQNPCPVFID